LDQRLIVIFWSAGSGIFLASIGALFGGFAGYVARRHGRSPGGFVGWRILRSVERMSKQELSPHLAGFVIGAFDGAAFLGTLGVGFGFLIGRTEWLALGHLGPILYTFALVAALAAVVGMAAYAFANGGIVIFGSACVGGLAGVYAGALVGEAAGILIGAWIGLILGFLVGWLGRRSRWPRTSRIHIEHEEGEP